MNNRNSILESLSEGMLTTAVSKGKGDITNFFNDLLKGKLSKSVELDSDITRVYVTDSRAKKVYKSKPIKSKTAKNLTFNELPNGYVSVVFNDLTIKRALVIHIDPMDFEDFIDDALTYDTDYAMFMADIDTNYTVLADVVYDDVQNRLCLTGSEVINVFLRKYFDINNGTKFTRWFVHSNLDSMVSDIAGGLHTHPSGKSWLLHVGGVIIDKKRFSEYVDLFPALSSDFHSTCSFTGNVASFQLRIKD